MGQNKLDKKILRNIYEKKLLKIIDNVKEDYNIIFIYDFITNLISDGPKKFKKYEAQKKKKKKKKAKKKLG